MILVNKVQIDSRELGKRLGIVIPFDKIYKKPLFEINPALIHKDPANGPLAVKLRNEMEFPCVFHAYTKTGESVEIRYCTNRTPDAKFMGQTEKYAPRVVTFEGKAEFITDKDKAVYFWLHFYNKTSPFPVEGVPFEYALVDDEARANELIKGITLRNEATAHAMKLSGDQLRITAKGMKISGAATMDDLSIRAQLMQFASDKPAEYLNKAQSQVNHIEGLIRDSVDKGIFILENVFNSKRWKWAMGVKAGGVIVEMSSSVTDEVQSLITEISLNIQEYLPVLINTSKTVNAKSNLADAVKDINVFEMLGVDKPEENKSTPKYVSQEEYIEPILNPKAPYGLQIPAGNPDERQQIFDEKDEYNGELEGDSFTGLPTSYKEAQDYLGQKIDKKTPALAKRLNDGIQDGSITADNIDMILAEMKME